MIVALEKKKNNIIEYLLYMWNLEDILRSLNLDIEEVKSKIVSQYQVQENIKEEIAQWYEGLIAEMKRSKLQEKGHLSELQELITELNFLHESLLFLYDDQKYKKLFETAENNLKALSERSQKKDISIIEAGLNGLFGIMLLRMRQKEISVETEESIKTISNLFALLSIRYKEMKAGKLILNSERNN